MASNLPPVWRFDFGDYADLGATFQKFLANLNLFTLAIYNLMNGGIGFSNMQRVIYKITIIDNGVFPQSFSFVNPLPIPPSGIQVVKVLLAGKTQPINDNINISNWFYDGRNINVLSVIGMTNVGIAYDLSIEVM